MARKKWAEIKAGVPADVRRRAAEKTRQMSGAIQLDDLRRMIGLTQEELASRLGTNQPSVSKLERREDMYLSTLQDVVGAMGGSLEIYARFPGQLVRLR